MKMIGIIIFGMFAMVLMSLNSMYVKAIEYPFNYTLGTNGGNWSGSPICTFGGGRMTCPTATTSNALLVHRLLNISETRSNVSIDLYNLSMKSTSGTFTFISFSVVNTTTLDTGDARWYIRTNNVGDVTVCEGAGITCKAILTDSNFGNHTYRFSQLTNSSLDFYADEVYKGNIAEPTADGYKRGNLSFIWFRSDSFWELGLDGIANYAENDNITPIISISTNTTNYKLDTVLNFSANLTDSINPSFINTGLLSANITYNISGSITYINFSLSGETFEIHNVTKLCSSACFLNFTVFATDIYNNVNQKSEMISVGDIIKPNLFSYNFSLFSIVDGNQLNVTVNASDDYRIDDINISLTNPNGLILNRSCENLNVNNYLCNITLFDGDETSVVGIWNLTRVLVSDTSENINVTYPNITFEVTSAGGGGSSSSSSSSGGGGGGGGFEPSCEEGFALVKNECVNLTTFNITFKIIGLQRIEPIVFYRGCFTGGGQEWRQLLRFNKIVKNASFEKPQLSTDIKIIDSSVLIVKKLTPPALSSRIDIGKLRVIDESNQVVFVDLAILVISLCNPLIYLFIIIPAGIFIFRKKIAKFLKKK